MQLDIWKWTLFHLLLTNISKLPLFSTPNFMPLSFFSQTEPKTCNELLLEQYSGQQNQAIRHLGMNPLKKKKKNEGLPFIFTLLRTHAKNLRLNCPLQPTHSHPKINMTVPSQKERKQKGIFGPYHRRKFGDISSFSNPLTSTAWEWKFSYCT